MTLIQTILSLIITLGILVTIHEYGHYWVAKRCGVKVLRFSVGFGRPIFMWKNKDGTEFAIASIPLGGFVKMLDEREAPVETALLPYAFNRKPVSQRIAIVSAGPIANFLFAIAAYWLMFIIGFSALTPTIGEIDQESVAARAGLYPGLEITQVDGRDTLSWRSVSMALVNRIGDSGDIELFAKAGASETADGYTLSVENWMLDREPHGLLKDLGVHPLKPPVPAVMGSVLADSPAEQGGLKAGDKVIEAGGKVIEDWFAFVDVIKVSAEKDVVVKVERSGENNGLIVETLSLRPEVFIREDGASVGRLGVSVQPFTYPKEMIRTISYGPLESLMQASEQVWADCVMTLNAIKKMIMGLISLDNLSGPITIAQVASESIESGSEEFLRFLALLSVSLGILNLLSIPVLDGGHIFYYLIEAVKGEPLSEKWQVLGLKVGVSFILILMSLA
ncbi:zinc metallopeptidase RseP, partial [Oleiphilus sp. HI0068]